MKLLNRLANLIGWLVILAAAAAGLAWWQGVPYLRHQVSEVVRNRLTLSPSAEVTVELAGPRRVAAGHIESITVVSPEASISGVPVRDFRMEAGELSFDPVDTVLLGDPKLSSITEGEFSFRVTEDALAGVWADQASRVNIDNFQLDINPERVEVSGSVDLMVTELDVSASGVFEAQGSKIVFVERGRNVDGEDEEGEGSAGNLLDKLLTRFRPTIDLASVGEGFTVERLELREGEVFVEGRAEQIGSAVASEVE